MREVSKQWADLTKDVEESNPEEAKPDEHEAVASEVEAEGVDSSTSPPTKSVTQPDNTYSFTERKRVRKDFGKQRGVLDAPYLLAIQLDSYQEFLQAEKTPEQRGLKGTACGVQVRVPDRELFRRRGAGIRELPARRSDLRRQGVPVAG